MATFYTQVKGTISGPFDAEKLKALAAAGEISPEDQISEDGKADWVAAKNLTGLLSAAEAPQQEIALSERVQTAAKELGGAVLDALPTGFLTRRRRIAITGLANTGKTVFLTTLINHLKHHDPTTFHLVLVYRPPLCQHWTASVLCFVERAWRCLRSRP